MTLANLANIPDFNDPRSVNQFSFNNFENHQLIVIGILAQKNIGLQVYELDPIALHDLDNWLLRHQTMHNDMNAALGLQGQDLSELDPNDEKELSAWNWLHFNEHRAANNALEI